MIKFEIPGHEHSLLPDGAEYTLAWSDEFDGDTLDRTRWDYRLSMMGKRHPAWTDKGVTLDGNSNAVFTLIEENGMPVSSQLQTGYNFMDEPVEKTTFGVDHLQWNIGKLKRNLYTHKYGYYECRCRLQQKDGWWSAFWIQSPIIGASLDPADTGVEVDIMESFKPGEIVEHNVFHGGYGKDNARDTASKPSTLDKTVFHRFGLLFDETGYTFHIDGKEDGKVAKNISGHDEFILITTEVSGYRSENHMPTEQARAAVGDTFLVDYVRVFDIKK